MDGNFIFTAFKYKLDIVHRLQSLLQESSIQTYVLRSVIDELKAVGQKAESSLQWAMACCTVIDDSDITNRNPAERIVELLGEFTRLFYKIRNPHGMFICRKDQRNKKIFRRISR